MTSTLDDEDLALPISQSQARRDSKESRDRDISGSSRLPPASATQQASISRPSKGSDRLGAYNIIRTLGEGSFGKVKLATHRMTGQQVALKIISRRKLITRDMAGRVEREIQYLQLLRHPHIIKLYTVITMPGEIVMVLEYAGNELFDYIVTHGKMAEDKARKFFQQIVCAVEYCHRHKIVHRDLKPENLLLDEQLNVKIADFGLSNIMTDGNFLKTSCGSPNYAAPEVISGKLYAGPEVDVWSCGVILYVLLVGRLPFDDDYIPALFKKIAQGNYNVPNYLSSGVVRLIRKMLQVNPMQRITIQEIRQDPWFTKDLAEYLQPPVEEFMETGVDPNKAIDPHDLAKGKPVAVQERLHESVVGKLGKTMGYGADDVQEALAKDEPSAIKDAYLIVRENQLMKANPSLAQDQPAFMAQSPPALYNNSLPTSPRSPSVRPPPSPLTSMDKNRHGSGGSTQLIESRSPASTIAVLPSSLPEYHVAYMRGHVSSDPPAAPSQEAPTEGRPRTKEEKEAAARRLKPHSRSTTNMQRNAAKPPEPMTSLPDEKPVVKKVKPQKWQFGIRSRNTPCEAMLALYKALQKMGAQWEDPKIKDPGSTDDNENDDGGSPARQRPGSQSPEYSDSDPDPGTDPEYATHSDQEARRSRRRRRRGGQKPSPSSANKSKSSRDPFGPWNDWGYAIPEDPWVICARFKKQGMFPPGVAHPSSTHSSRVDLHDGLGRRGSSAAAGTSSTTNSSVENFSASSSAVGGGAQPAPAPEQSVWVYVTIQLYNIEKDFFLVDFKCDGYERLVRRFAREVGEQGLGEGGEEVDVVRVDSSGDREDGKGKGKGMEGEEDEDGDDDDEEEEVGVGRYAEEKDISSPFPFLDVASRLIIQLAEAQD